MKHDPIVEEIHQVRQKILAECNGNLDRIGKCIFPAPQVPVTQG
jgi:hypothetical protein